MKDTLTASLIMAAGRGSRLKEFGGNKTLLPLIPGKSPLEGTRPILLHILDSLPPGPKAIVVHHKKEDVMEATAHLGVSYYVQEELDGTGGALLAARKFLEIQKGRNLIITMGDVPLVGRETYESLILELEGKDLVVLGFCPASKRQYGVLELKGGQVKRIVEWKYWREYPPEKQTTLRICNSGIYAAATDALLRYLPTLASRPHTVRKEVDGRERELKEFFITDIIQYMNEEGGEVGWRLARDEQEVTGVDDLTSLAKVQAIFRDRSSGKRNG